MADERHQQRDGRQQGGRERSKDGVCGAPHQPPVAGAAGDDGGAGGVQGESQHQQQRGAADGGQGQAPPPPPEYLLGHLVTSESGLATNRSPTMWPVTMMCRPSRKASGTEPLW